MDGCNVLPETQFFGTRLRMDTTRVLSVRGFLHPWGDAGERSELSIKPPLGAPLMIFLRGYLLMSFPQVDTSARQRGFEIRVFHLLGELPKAIEPNQSVRLLYRWQLGPTGTRSSLGKASALEKPRTWVRVLASVRFFICSVASFLLCCPCEALEGSISTRVCII